MDKIVLFVIINFIIIEIVRCEIRRDDKVWYGMINTPKLQWHRKNTETNDIDKMKDNYVLNIVWEYAWNGGKGAGGTREWTHTWMSHM